MTREEAIERARREIGWHETNRQIYLAEALRIVRIWTRLRK